MVKLTKKQLAEVIKSELKSDNGLNEIFKLTLECLMLLEREEQISTVSNNKCNGYRSKKSVGFGSGFELSIPRDR